MTPMDVYAGLVEFLDPSGLPEGDRRIASVLAWTALLFAIAILAIVALVVIGI